MSDLINEGEVYRQYAKTQYCFRPKSSRQVNSVKELNRLLGRIAELEEEIVALHNPHTGNECDCAICEKFGKRGER